MFLLSPQNSLSPYKMTHSTILYIDKQCEKKPKRSKNLSGHFFQKQNIFLIIYLRLYIFFNLHCVASVSPCWPGEVWHQQCTVSHETTGTTCGMDWWAVIGSLKSLRGSFMEVTRSCEGHVIYAPSSAGWNQGIPRRPSLPPGGTKYVDTFQLCVLDIVCCLVMSVLVVLNADWRTPSVAAAAAAAAAAATNWCSSRTFRVLVQFLQDCVGVFSMVLIGWLCCCCCYCLLIGSWSCWSKGRLVGTDLNLDGLQPSTSLFLCVCVHWFRGRTQSTFFFFVISGMWHF